MQKGMRLSHPFFVTKRHPFFNIGGEIMKKQSIKQLAAMNMHYARYSLDYFFDSIARLYFLYIFFGNSNQKGTAPPWAGGGLRDPRTVHLPV